MYRSSKDNKHWPRRSAVIITTASGNFGMLVKELLRTFHWTVLEMTPSPSTALSKVKQGQANLIIIDDSIELPSSYSLRCLFSNPLGPITPILAFCNENNQIENNVLRAIGKTILTAKPLTPGRFQTGFEALLKQWSEGYYLALRDTLDLLTNGNERAALAILQKLNQYSGAQSLVSPSLALFCIKEGQLKTAESLLLRVLKQKPRDLGVIIPLVDIYMEHAMPELAYRILKSVQEAFNNTIAFGPDIIQAMIQTDRLQEAVDQCEKLFNAQFHSPKGADHLAKLLYAYGKTLSIKGFNHRSSVIEGVTRSWQKHASSRQNNVKAS